MLALHDYMSGSHDRTGGATHIGHCSCTTTLRCRIGCRAFLSDGERIELALRAMGTERRLPPALRSRTETSNTVTDLPNSFCHGGQAAAEQCLLYALSPAPCGPLHARRSKKTCRKCCDAGGCTLRNVSQASVDLMPRIRTRLLQARMRRILNSSEAAKYHLLRVAAGAPFTR